MHRPLVRMQTSPRHRGPIRTPKLRRVNSLRFGIRSPRNSDFRSRTPTRFDNVLRQPAVGSIRANHGRRRREREPGDRRFAGCHPPTRQSASSPYSHDDIDEYEYSKYDCTATSHKHDKTRAEGRSVVKVDIIAALLRQATQTSSTLSQAETSELQRMIELSDNDAATSLWNTVGGPEGLRAFNDRVGLAETTPSMCVECPGFPWPGWGLTTTTAADQVRLLQTIALPNAILTNASRATALGLMDNVTPSERWGVTGGVPDDVAVALKNGWLPLSNGDWQINSVGWIRGQGRNYMLAILTTGNPSEDYGIATTDEISSLVWQALPPTRTG